MSRSTPHASKHATPVPTETIATAVRQAAGVYVGHVRTRCGDHNHPFTTHRHCKAARTTQPKKSSRHQPVTPCGNIPQTNTMRTRPPRTGHTSVVAKPDHKWVKALHVNTDTDMLMQVKSRCWWVRAHWWPVGGLSQKGATSPARTRSSR